MNDFLLFLRYIFDPKGLLEEIMGGMQKVLKPKMFSIVLIYASIGTLFFLPPTKNYIVSFILIVIALVLQLRNAYKGGEHRHWNRERVKSKARKFDEAGDE